MDEQYEFDFNDGDTIVALRDNVDQTIIVITLDQVEALLEWYCKQFKRIIV
jgi:hypothetical protein